MKTRCLFGMLSLLAALACGGSHTETVPAASGLAYTDPVSTGWRLALDPSSTPKRVVLNLVGPSGLQARGAAFTLQADTKAVSFGKFDGAYLRDGGVFVLAENPDEPKLLAGGVKGDVLMVGAFQKNRSEGAKDVGVPLFQVALELKDDGTAVPGAEIPLKILKGRILPEDINTSSAMAMQTITPELGKLVAR